MICEIKPPAMREHTALYQSIRQQVYTILDSPLSTWENLSKQERAAERRSFVPFATSSQGFRIPPGKLLLAFVFFPSAFLPLSSPPLNKRKKQQSLTHSCSSCKKVCRGILLHCSCILSQPWVRARFCSWNESHDAVAGSGGEQSAVGLVLFVKMHNWASYKLLPSHCTDSIGSR